MPEVKQSEPPAWLRRLYLPSYRIADAARYTGTSSQRVSYWHYGGGKLGPALEGKGQLAPLSYFQLIEVAFVATFRDAGLSLQKLRRTREYVAQVFKIDYPFARLQFKTDGLDVFLDLATQLPELGLDAVVTASRHGQQMWREVVLDRFAQFEYDDTHGLATVWHPSPSHPLVTIDPRKQFGAPAIRGIPTWTLAGRRNAGESVAEIGYDFGLEEHEVEQGLDWERFDVAS